MDSYGINILCIARFSLLFSISQLKAVCNFMLSDQKAYHCRHNIYARTFIVAKQSPLSRLNTKDSLTRYPVSGRIFSQISSIRSDIWHDIQYPVGYLARYSVSGRIFSQTPVSDRILSQISSIRSDTQPDIQYPVGYLARYPGLGGIFSQISSI